MRPAHPGITEIRCAFWENLFVRRLDMCMRANDETDLAIEIPSHRNLFAGRLGMNVHDDDVGLPAQLGHFTLGSSERAVVVGHVNTTKQIQHAHPRLFPDIDYHRAASRRRRCDIQWTHNLWQTVNFLLKTFLIPNMIAGGDDIHAGRQQFFDRCRRQPGTVRDVLAIGHDTIEMVLALEFRQQRRDRLPTGFTNDVADEKNVHTRLMPDPGQQINAG